MFGVVVVLIVIAFVLLRIARNQEETMHVAAEQHRQAAYQAVRVELMTTAPCWLRFLDEVMSDGTELEQSFWMSAFVNWRPDTTRIPPARLSRTDAHGLQRWCEGHHPDDPRMLDTVAEAMLGYMANPGPPNRADAGRVAIDPGEAAEAACELARLLDTADIMRVESLGDEVLKEIGGSRYSDEFVRVATPRAEREAMFQELAARAATFRQVLNAAARLGRETRLVDHNLTRVELAVAAVRDHLAANP